jgi:C-terminal processing protease CtpA/Prc
MKRLLTVVAAPLLVALLSGPATAQMPDAPDFQVSPEERARLLDESLKRLHEIYVFPDTAQKMADAVLARRAKGEYDGITSGRDLARKLTDDLVAVSHDRHLRVRAWANGAPETTDSGPPPAERAEEERRLRRINYGFEKVERLTGNVGYVEIRGFMPPGLAGETASAAMTLVANTDALIVDLRRNGGGEPAMIAYVLSYLFDEPTHLNDIHERVGDRTQQFWTMPHVPGLRFGGSKPVFVLTSDYTFSGGEEFAYNVKTQKRGMLIGETTGGGAHPVRPVKVTEHFAIGVPFARAINPITGTNWEGTGVAPDIAVPASEALDVAHVMAVEKILETTGDPEQKQQLQQWLSERKETKRRVP